MVTETLDILKVAGGFYKTLFRKDSQRACSLNNDFFSAEEKLSPNESETPQAPFSEEEIKKSVFDTYADGAPGPDGIPFFFYQHFWDLIKHDLIEMFDDFHKGKIDICIYIG